MARQATLTVDDMALCVSSLMMSARLGMEKLPPDQAMSLQLRCNTIASNLQHGSITEEDVQNICISLQAMRELLLKDRQIPQRQRAAVLQQTAILQQKLQRGSKG